MLFFCIFLLFALILCALFRKRSVRTGFKLFGASFFFEADDRDVHNVLVDHDDATAATALAPRKD